MANFYLVLFYNAEIWYLPTLNPPLQTTFIISIALTLCTIYYNDHTSFQDLHTLNNRATPNQLMHYKHALLIYELQNIKEPNQEWV